MIKTLISNELANILGHQPSSTEFASALAYITKYVESDHKLVDVELLFRDWRDECCTKCDCCCEYFLSEFVEEKLIGIGFKHVCSQDCLIELQNDL